MTECAKHALPSLSLSLALSLSLSLSLSLPLSLSLSLSLPAAPLCPVMLGSLIYHNFTPYQLFKISIIIHNLIFLSSLTLS